MMTEEESTASQQFWNWFEQNRLPFEFFEEMTPDQQEEMLEKSDEMAAAYSEGVAVQIGRNMVPQGPAFRIIVSANGQTAYFEKAKALAATAPEMPNWQVYALVPPLNREIKIRFDLESGILYPDDMWFQLMEAPEQPQFLGVHIALRHFDHYEAADKLDELQYIVVQMVANIIGEESWAMDIQHLEIGPMPPDPMEEGFQPLYDLPEHIAEFRKEHPRPEL